ncbi:MAG: hypothetical protein HY854_11245 [Burkholderiales bacterium]|nr:hypothetical protein [Burkholderiales bacterium]
MKTMHSPSRIALALAALLAGALALAQPADVFDFVPQGGRTLLAKVIGTGAGAADVNALLAERHTRDEWAAILKSRSQQFPAAARLSDKERQTLADYMAFNLPLAAGRVKPGSPVPTLEKALPMDGRDMTLEKCQGCHIVTVVVTQDRKKEAWLGTMNKPSHIQIRLSPAQREALANYLVLNAAIPIDDVPKELRAGGASY